MFGKNKIRQEVFVTKDSYEDVEPDKNFVIHFSQGAAKQIEGSH